MLNNLRLFKLSMYRARIGFAALLLMLPTLLFALHVDFSTGLLHYLEDKWDDEAPERALSWQQLIRKQEKLAASLGSPERAERSAVSADNPFWNRIPYFRDTVHWGVDDYWATPLESLGSNGADCEDYAIGKYFTLKELGVPAQKLRITYVRALKWNETHMVLAYYPEPDADPYILDNLVPEILPASQRPDLEPVYSFNDDDLWTATMQQRSVGKSSQIRKWRDLLEKMEKERKL